MNKTESPLEEQIKAAKRDHLLSKIAVAKSEKKKIDLDFAESKKRYSKHWWQNKKVWSILAGTLIAWTAVAVYITFSVIPLSEIHIHQVTFENELKSDTLHDRERQLKLANDTLKAKERYLVILYKTLDQQKLENNKLRVSRHSLDSSYSILYRLYSSKHEVSQSEIKEQFVKFKQYLDDYKQQLKTESNPSTISLANLNPSIRQNWAMPTNYTTPTLEGSPSLDSIMKSWHRGESLTLLTLSPKVTMRPLFDGAVLKDLTIRLRSMAQSFLFSSASNQYVSPLTSDQVTTFSFESGYSNTMALSGSYDCDLQSDNYEIASIRCSNSSVLTSKNHISFLTPSYGDIVFDLILEKK